MKNLFGIYRPQNSVLLIGLLFILSACQIISAQTAGNKGVSAKVATHKNENPAIVRWRIFLDSMIQEARTVFPEERRPFAIVDVAGAYWEIDREAASALYVSALDSAWNLTEQDNKNRRVLNYVLSSATRLDSNLAKTLTKRLIEKEDSDRERDGISSATALEILNEDVAKAAQLAEAFAPNGLQYGTATFLIYRIAEQDVQLSNRVYGVYLNKVGANENIPLELILPLGGYAFGYAEFYSIDSKGQMFGSTFPQIKGLSANPNFTNAYLNLAFRRIARAIEMRNDVVGAQFENLNYQILFALEYLMPEAARFAPNSLSAWQQLQQQGMVGVTLQQMTQISAHINAINQARARAQRFTDSSQAAEEEAEANLENVEKLTGTCQRDAVYSQAALTFSSRKNFKRANEIAGNIEDLKQSAVVKEALFYDMTISAIGSEDWETAQENLKKLSSIELKTMAYAKLATALASKNEKTQSASVFSEAVAIAEKVPEAEIRSGFLFALSTIILKSDPLEAQSLIKNAVKSLNKQEARDLGYFSIPIKVSLSCSGAENNWYGDSISLSNSNVFDALTIFAKQNPEEAKLTAESIDDKVTKIRTLAAVAKTALANEKIKKKK